MIWWDLSCLYYYSSTAVFAACRGKEIGVENALEKFNEKRKEGGDKE